MAKFNTKKERKKLSLDDCSNRGRMTFAKALIYKGASNLPKGVDLLINMTLQKITIIGIPENTKMNQLRRNVNLVLAKMKRWGIISPFLIETNNVSFSW